MIKIVRTMQDPIPVSVTLVSYSMMMDIIVMVSKSRVLDLYNAKCAQVKKNIGAILGSINEDLELI